VVNQKWESTSAAKNGSRKKTGHLLAREKNKTSELWLTGEKLCVDDSGRWTKHRHEQKTKTKKKTTARRKTQNKTGFRSSSRTKLKKGKTNSTHEIQT
jgi:hypothetical protein